MIITYNWLDKYQIIGFDTNLMYFATRTKLVRGSPSYTDPLASDVSYTDPLASDVSYTDPLQTTPSYT